MTKIIVHFISLQVINAFMLVISSKHNVDHVDDKNHVYCLPSYMAVLWDRDVYDNWLYKQVRICL